MSLSVSPDPLPPTALMVSATTTTSVKVQWKYDSSKSLCVKWKVNYTEINKNNTKEINIDSASARDAIIDSLSPGLTYALSVFAVTTNDVASQTSAEMEATVSTYSFLVRHTTIYSVSVGNAWIIEIHIYDLA